MLQDLSSDLLLEIAYKLKYSTIGPILITCKDLLDLYKYNKRFIIRKIINNYILLFTDPSNIDFLIKKNTIDTDSLKLAAYYGRTEDLKFLIKNGADDIHIDESYLIRYASKNGHPETVRLLIGLEADINAMHGMSLLWAVQYGHIEVTRLLIEKGANVNVCDNHLFPWVAQYGYLNILKFLIKDTETGEYVKDATVIDDFISQNDAENAYFIIVKLLISKGADINSMIDITNKNMALHIATYDGQLKTIEFLIDCGANINSMGGVALKIAANCGHLEVVKLFIKKGMDILSISNYILYEINERQDLDMINFLNENGVNMNSIECPRMPDIISLNIMDV